MPTSKIRIVLMALSAFAVCAHAGAASANDYLDRREAAMACGRLRIAALTLLSAQNGRLLSASPDLDPDGWVHPAIINDAFRELQKLTMYFDHDLQQIESEGPARVLACRQLAFDVAYRGESAGARVRPKRFNCYRVPSDAAMPLDGVRRGIATCPRLRSPAKLFAEHLVQLPQ
jgi:hypothetical protein